MKILHTDLYYDVIISDFGRNAAVRYITLLDALEEEKIKQHLDPLNLTFYDEYRRIMFNMIAEVYTFKQHEIEDQIRRLNLINENILIGVGDTEMSSLFYDAFLKRILTTIATIPNEIYKEVRLSIICNSLSPLIEDIVAKLNSNALLESVVERLGLPNEIADKVANFSIKSRTLPKSAINQLGTDAPYLILGLKNAAKYYADYKDIDIIKLTDEEYKVLDQAVVSSVSNDDTLKEQSRLQLKKIVDKYSQQHPKMNIIEACTDFEFGLGHNSITLFAKDMIEEVYH